MQGNAARREGDVILFDAQEVQFFFFRSWSTSTFFLGYALSISCYQLSQAPATCILKLFLLLLR